MIDHGYRDHRGDRWVRLARPICTALAFCICILLIPAATAGADVMKKHRTPYKTKLNYYRVQMDEEHDFYRGSRIAVEQHIHSIGTAVADPELQAGVPILEEAALVGRTNLLQDLRVSRDKMYANIAAFRSEGVKWFRTAKDKRRFKTRLVILRSGFVRIYEADVELANALLSLGTNADIAAAKASVLDAQVDVLAAEGLFTRGLRLLRALQ